MSSSTVVLLVNPDPIHRHQQAAAIVRQGCWAIGVGTVQEAIDRDLPGLDLIVADVTVTIEDFARLFSAPFASPVLMLPRTGTAAQRLAWALRSAG